MDSLTTTKLVAFLLAGLSGTISFVISVVVLVVALVRWSTVRSHLRQGTILAIVFGALSLPGVVATVLWADPSALFPALPTEFGWILNIAMLGGTIVGTGLAIGLQVLKVPVAILVARGRPSFHLLLKQDHPFRGWVLAAVVGTLSALLSVALFRWLGVTESEELQQATRLFPGVDWNSPPMQLGFALPTVLAAAVGEEVFYRGIVQGWLARTWGSFRAGPWLAIALTTLLWTATHSLNASHLVPKLVQIAVLGLLFGALARRYGTESSTIAHGALNTLAVIANLVFPNAHSHL